MFADFIKMGAFKLSLTFLLVSCGYLLQPASANDGFKELCNVAQMANRDGSSGKQEISAALQRAYGWSKYKADATTSLVVRENYPGVW